MIWLRIKVRHYPLQYTFNVSSSKSQAKGHKTLANNKTVFEKVIDSFIPSGLCRCSCIRPYSSYSAQFSKLFVLFCAILKCIRLVLRNSQTYSSHSAQFSNLFVLFCAILKPIRLILHNSQTYSSYSAQFSNLFVLFCAILKSIHLIFCAILIQQQLSQSKMAAAYWSFASDQM